MTILHSTLSSPWHLPTSPSQYLWHHQLGRWWTKRNPQWLKISMPQILTRLPFPLLDLSVNACLILAKSYDAYVVEVIEFVLYRQWHCLLQGLLLSLSCSQLRWCELAIGSPHFSLNHHYWLVSTLFLKRVSFFLISQHLIVFYFYCDYSEVTKKKKNLSVLLYYKTLLLRCIFLYFHS